ncbi:MAG: hypothetical protein V5B40_13230 [Candidatus Accumulibacter meliphilus]|jgi:hypothetical protein|uniref:hypothetical protein n=1 Tax=Candidatus Accumulibacter meliphilus TaxID=2211374 RepID=UPI002FC2E5E4
MSTPFVKTHTSASKANKNRGVASQQSSSGKNGVAVAPPAYGVDFVDRGVPAGASHVESLTNEELIAAMAIGSGRGSSVLGREQERRVRLGHKWLEETWDVAPSRLIQVVPKGPAIEVLVADMALAMGSPIDIRNKPILSEQQFSAFLAAHAIPAMTPREYLAARAGRAGALGALGGDAHLQGVQVAEARAFSRQPSTTWMGQRAEYGQMSHPLFGDLLHYDYNNRGWVDTRGGANVLHLAAERNFPIVDLRSRPTGANQSLKTSVQDPSGRNRYYAEGLGDLTGGRRPDLFATMLQNLPGGQTTATDFLASAQLLIPPGDVAAFQSLLSNPTAPMTAKSRQPLYRLQSFTPIFDGLLAADPARSTPGGPQYKSVAALDAAVAANVMTQAQMDAVLQQRGQRAAGMVAGHREGVGDLRADVKLRSRTGSPASTEGIVGPEYLAASRYGRQYGSWGAGVSAGALGVAPRGGAAGALIAVITDTGIMLFDGRDNPEAVERLKRSAGYGFLGGTTGAATEFAAQAQIQRQLVARTLTAGAPTAVRSTLLRGAGGAAGGGIASLAVETWQIATEEGPHSGEEVALREGRALVIGATSGFLATVAGTAATGALAGTVVPVVGNAVGLVVGLLVGVGVALAMEAAIRRPKRTGE